MEGFRDVNDLEVKFKEGERFEKWLADYFAQHKLILKRKENIPFIKDYYVVKSIQGRLKVNFEIISFEGKTLGFGSATWRRHVGESDFWYRSWYWDKHPNETVLFLGIDGDPDKPEKVLAQFKMNLKPIKKVEQQIKGDRSSYPVYVFRLSDMQPIFPPNLLTISLPDLLIKKFQVNG